MDDETRPPEADLTPLAQDLTKTQIQARRDPAATELDYLVEHGDKTLEVGRRVRQLRELIMAADAMITEIQATTFESITQPPEPTPAPAEPAPAEPAPVPEAQLAPAAPASETPPASEAAPAVPVAAVDPEPQPTPAPEPKPDGDKEDSGEGDSGGEGIGGMSDQQLTNTLAHIRAELDGRGEAPGEGTGAPQTTEPQLAPGAHQGGAPILATTGGGSYADVMPEGRTTLRDIGNRMLNLRKMAHLIPGDQPQRFNMMRVDKLHGLEVPKLGEDPELNTQLLFHEPRENLALDSIAAAADLNICGDPTEITVRGCNLDSTTPFLDALAGNSIGAEECVVRWRRPLSVEQINPGPQLWTACQQELVDPADRATWKPISADLGPCQDYCTAQPFDTIMGLGVTLNDMTCRPEQIEEMNRWIEVFQAILLEQTAMSIFDMQVGAEHHFSFDANSLATTGDPGNGIDARPQLGALPALTYAVHALTSRSGIDRHTPNRGWTISMHPSILPTIAYDMHLAQETPPADVAAALLDFLRPAGVENIILQKDFGICEGVLVAGYQANAFLCNLENCDIPTYLDPANCTAFGAGNDLAPLVTDTRIRFFQSSNWWHGTTSLVDYALHTSAELMRQNRAEWFGERRDILFKASSCHSLEMVLDVANLCATGQRIRHDAYMPCPAPTGAGVNLPPLAPGISGIGQPNPQSLPDQIDFDPATDPPRVGQGGPNPSPGTPPGSVIPGGQPVV